MDVSGHVPAVYGLAVLLSALGLWLLLPRGGGRGRVLGLALAAAGLGVWVSRWPPLGDWAAGGAFYTLAGATLAAAVGTVASRSPVRSAAWFALALLGTAGLLLVVGAQFLAAATVVVYVGAILVTLLFVLMLAQPLGRTAYDQHGWEVLTSAVTAAVIVGVLTATISSALLPARPAVAAPSAEQLQQGVLDPRHVERIGKELFGRRLLAVEAVGALLLAALVGAAVMAAKEKPSD